MGGYGWGDLALQVGGVSDEKVIYGYGSCTTLASAWLHCKGAWHQDEPVVTYFELELELGEPVALQVVRGDEKGT
jgi:hypothetical protein